MCIGDVSSVQNNNCTVQRSCPGESMKYPTVPHTTWEQLKLRLIRGESTTEGFNCWECYGTVCANYVHKSRRKFEVNQPIKGSENIICRKVANERTLGQKRTEKDSEAKQSKHLIEELCQFAEKHFTSRFFVREARSGPPNSG